jgi:hypothetical protein
VEVLPVPAPGVVRSRRWAGGLPALIVLLVLVGGSGVVRPADGPTLVTGGAALATAAASVQSPAAAPRADFRLLVKRGGHWTAGPVFAAGTVLPLGIVPPAGWWAVVALGPVAGRTVRGEGHRGRAPPFTA